MLRDRLRQGLRAFSSRNFRLFFAGQSVSLLGTWMQRIAMGWLVYRLTDSAFMLGLIGFTNLAPMFFIGPFGGVIADRWNRHRTLVATQSLAMLQAAALTALTLTGHVAVWHIVLLSLFLGVVTAFDVPVRQSLVVQLVDRKEDLGNAIALGSTSFNIARLLGPSLAGLLTAYVGEWLCFLANTVTFGVVIVALLAMRIPPIERDTNPARPVRALVDGVKYAFGMSPIRTILFLLATFSLFGIPYATLMPVFARDILGGGAETLGFLMASAGGGAMIGALYLASRTGVGGMGRVIPVAATLFAVGVMVFSQSRTLWLSYAAVAAAGFGQQLATAGSNITVQTIVDDDMRGRVMSLFTVSILGMAPFGALLAGTLAEVLGVPLTIVINSSVVLVTAVVFWVRMPRIRGATRQTYDDPVGPV